MAPLSVGVTPTLSKCVCKIPLLCNLNQLTDRNALRLPQQSLLETATA